VLRRNGDYLYLCWQGFISVEDARAIVAASGINSKYVNQANWIALP